MNAIKLPVLLTASLIVCSCSSSSQLRDTGAPAPAEIACPVAYPDSAQRESWKMRVEAAQAMTDSIEQRDAMVALVREALPGVNVRLAGNVSPALPHPEDYVPYPAVNFDINLGDKRDSDTGYYFTAAGKTYVVLGPGALHPRGPITTQNNAAHEMYHAEHHVGDSRPMLDREVEVWTHIFTSTFHQDYPYRMLWNPLTSSYEGASPAEQAITLHMLANYYETAAGVEPACVPEFRAEFDGWVKRRIHDEKTRWKSLVNALDKALGLNAAAAAASTEGR